jgi:aspartate aminotransferase
VANAEDFCVWLLSEFEHEGATVMLAPANGFYTSDLGKSEVRIAYVLNVEDLQRAIEVLRVALTKYR